MGGGSGDDVFIVEGGQYKVYSGEGDDALWIAENHATITINTGPGDNIVSGLGTGTKHVSLGVGSNFVETGDGDDRIEGGPGDDFIITGAGNDIILPGGGADVVMAGAGNDVVRIRSSCEYGEKWLEGGEGTDTLLLPTTEAEASAAGMVFVGFEHIVEYASEEGDLDDCQDTGGA
jgi:Ca2+-binding RTX toxin-like protein